MSVLAVDEWLNQLEAIPREDLTNPRMHAFIQSNAIDPETLRPYIFFAKSHYTRNLIHRSDFFEVLATCWEIGQASPPHDHGGQNCWMVTPVGRLRVQNFRVATRDPGLKTCQLVATTSYDIDAEHPALVEPEEPVHQVMNLPQFARRATSVQVYSRPYSTCEVYNRSTDTYSIKELTYWSKYGKPCRAGQSM